MVSTCALATPPKKYGGTELVVAELTKSLLKLGHHVTVYATGDSGVFGDLRYHFAEPVWPPNELAEMRHAGFAWQDIVTGPGGYDVVHLHHAAALPMAWTAHQPTVLTVHHSHADALVEHYRAYPDVAYVAISDRQAELSSHLCFERVIHHGLDPELYERGRGDGDYVAFLGRFAPEKAPHLAIDAARAAGVRLVLGGAVHELPECRSYFDRELEPRLSNANDLEWLGELGHRPKVNMLGHARALLVPLEWEEPFGLVMIEAMLVGTPVIAFARGSAPELIDEGVTGFLVRDQHQMAERIRQLAHIDRKRCRARALERWSSMRMAQDHVELYQQLLRERGRRSGLQRVAPHGRARASSDSGEILTVAANPSNVLAAVGTDRATRR